LRLSSFIKFVSRRIQEASETLVHSCSKTSLGVL
jgi:hypothetical protein